MRVGMHARVSAVGHVHMRTQLRRLAVAARQRPPAPVLTAMISRSTSVDAVLALQAEHGAAFNAVHVSAFWNKLGRLARGCKRQRAWLQDNATPALSAGRNHTLALVADLGPRELADTARGLASLGTGSQAPWNEVWQQIQLAVQPRLGEFQPQELKDTTWACATAASVGGGEPRGGADFDAMAAEASGRLDEFSPDQLVLLSWSFAAAGHRSPGLFAAIGAEAHHRVAALEATPLTQMAWAFARAGVEAPELFGALGEQLCLRREQLEPYHLATAAWAFARAGLGGGEVGAVLTAAALERVRDFGATEIATMAQALAMGGAAQGEQQALLMALAAEAVGRVGDFKPRELAGLGRSFASLSVAPRDGRAEAALFAALATELAARLARRGSDFSEASLASLPWTFVRLDIDAPAVFAAVAAEATPRLAAFTPQGLVSLVWCFAARHHPDEALYVALAEQLEQRQHELTLREQRAVRGAFRRIGLPPPLLVALHADEEHEPHQHALQHHEFEVHEEY